MDVPAGKRTVLSFNAAAHEKGDWELRVLVNGKIIDKIPVAGQTNFTSPLKVFTMQPNYTFEVKDFKNIFKEDPDKVGYDSNYVIRSEPLGSAYYRIRSDGKFEKTDAPLAISFPPNRSGSAIPQ